MRDVSAHPAPGSGRTTGDGRGLGRWRLLLRSLSRLGHAGRTQDSVQRQAFLVSVRALAREQGFVVLQPERAGIIELLLLKRDVRVAVVGRPLCGVSAAWSIARAAHCDAVWLSSGDPWRPILRLEASGEEGRGLQALSEPGRVTTGLLAA